MDSHLTLGDKNTKLGWGQGEWLSLQVPGHKGWRSVGKGWWPGRVGSSHVESSILFLTFFIAHS